jgi:hypothetical protein
MAVLLRATGERVPLTLERGARLLPQLQALVGGYIEVITLGGTAARRDVLVLNEDGKRDNLPGNLVATWLARHVIGADDWIVGDVVRATIEHCGSDRESWQ